MGTNDKIDQAKGRIEQAVGDLTDDEELRQQGEAHETGGKAKQAIDTAKDKLQKVVDIAEEKASKR